MKVWAIILLSLVVPVVCAQTLPSNDQIFAALYGSHYNPETKAATWHCPQAGDSAPDGCVFIGDSIAKPELLEMILMKDAGFSKAFVVASAVGRSSGCHECAPLIAVGVMEFRDNEWHLESRNDETFRFGAWGNPGDFELVKAGPNLYGFMFSNYDGGGGYFATYLTLLLPDGKNIPEVWEGALDEDNKGEYDPSGKDGSPQRIHVEAAYRFLPNFKADHYILQVVSRGYGYGRGSTRHSRNGAFNYHFLNGKYLLVSERKGRANKR